MLQGREPAEQVMASNLYKGLIKNQSYWHLDTRHPLAKALLSASFDHPLNAPAKVEGIDLYFVLPPCS